MASSSNEERDAPEARAIENIGLAELAEITTIWQAMEHVSAGVAEAAAEAKAEEGCKTKEISAAESQFLEGLGVAGQTTNTQDVQERAAAGVVVLAPDAAAKLRRQTEDRATAEASHAEEARLAAEAASRKIREAEELAAAETAAAMAEAEAKDQHEAEESSPAEAMFVVGLDVAQARTGNENATAEPQWFQAEKRNAAEARAFGEGSVDEETTSIKKRETEEQACTEPSQEEAEIATDAQAKERREAEDRATAQDGFPEQGRFAAEAEGMKIREADQLALMTAALAMAEAADDCRHEGEGSTAEEVTFLAESDETKLRAANACAAYEPERQEGEERDAAEAGVVVAASVAQETESTKKQEAQEHAAMGAADTAAEAEVEEGRKAEETSAAEARVLEEAGLACEINEQEVEERAAAGAVALATEAAAKGRQKAADRATAEASHAEEARLAAEAASRKLREAEESAPAKAAEAIAEAGARDQHEAEQNGGAEAIFVVGSDVTKARTANENAAADSERWQAEEREAAEARAFGEASFVEETESTKTREALEEACIGAATAAAEAEAAEQRTKEETFVAEAKAAEKARLAVEDEETETLGAEERTPAEVVEGTKIREAEQLAVVRAAEATPEAIAKCRHEAGGGIAGEATLAAESDEANPSAANACAAAELEQWGAGESDTAKAEVVAEAIVGQETESIKKREAEEHAAAGVAEAAAEAEAEEGRNAGTNSAAEARAVDGAGVAGETMNKQNFEEPTAAEAVALATKGVAKVRQETEDRPTAEASHAEEGRLAAEAERKKLREAAELAFAEAADAMAEAEIRDQHESEESVAAEAIFAVGSHVTQARTANENATVESVLWRTEEGDTAEATELGQASIAEETELIKKREDEEQACTDISKAAAEAEAAERHTTEETFAAETAEVKAVDDAIYSVEEEEETEKQEADKRVVAEDAEIATEAEAKERRDAEDRASAHAGLAKEASVAAEAERVEIGDAEQLAVVGAAEAVAEAVAEGRHEAEGSMAEETELLAGSDETRTRAANACAAVEPERREAEERDAAEATVVVEAIVVQEARSIKKGEAEVQAVAAIAKVEASEQQEAEERHGAEEAETATDAEAKEWREAEDTRTAEAGAAEEARLAAESERMKIRKPKELGAAEAAIATDAIDMHEGDESFAANTNTAEEEASSGELSVIERQAEYLAAAQVAQPGLDAKANKRLLTEDWGTSEVNTFQEARLFTEDEVQRRKDAETAANEKRECEESAVAEASAAKEALFAAEQGFDKNTVADVNDAAGSQTLEDAKKVEGEACCEEGEAAFSAIGSRAAALSANTAHCSFGTALYRLDGRSKGDDVPADVSDWESHIPSPSRCRPKTRVWEDTVPIELAATVAERVSSTKEGLALDLEASESARNTIADHAELAGPLMFAKPQAKATAPGDVVVAGLPFAEQRSAEKNLEDSPVAKAASEGFRKENSLRHPFQANSVALEITAQEAAEHIHLQDELRHPPQHLEDGAPKQTVISKVSRTARALAALAAITRVKDLPAALPSVSLSHGVVSPVLSHNIDRPLLFTPTRQEALDAGAVSAPLSAGLAAPPENIARRSSFRRSSRQSLNSNEDNESWVTAQELEDTQLDTQDIEEEQGVCECAYGAGVELDDRIIDDASKAPLQLASPFDAVQAPEPAAKLKTVPSIARLPDLQGILKAVMSPQPRFLSPRLGFASVKLSIAAPRFTVPVLVGSPASSSVSSRKRFPNGQVQDDRDVPQLKLARTTTVDNFSDLKSPVAAAWIASKEANASNAWPIIVPDATPKATAYTSAGPSSDLLHTPSDTHDSSFADAAPGTSSESSPDTPSDNMAPEKDQKSLDILPNMCGVAGDVDPAMTFCPDAFADLADSVSRSNTVSSCAATAQASFPHSEEPLGGRRRCAGTHNSGASVDAKWVSAPSEARSPSKITPPREELVGSVARQLSGSFAQTPLSAYLSRPLSRMQEIKCPQHHSLQQDGMPYPGNCDLCDAHLKAGTVVKRCSVCSYDLCNICANAHARAPPTIGVASTSVSLPSSFELTLRAAPRKRPGKNTGTSEQFVEPFASPLAMVAETSSSSSSRPKRCSDASATSPAPPAPDGDQLVHQPKQQRRRRSSQHNISCVDELVEVPLASVAFAAGHVDPAIFTSSVAKGGADGAPSLRRSGRQRMRPLEAWRNERAIYTRAPGSAAPELCGVVLNFGTPPKAFSWPEVPMKKRRGNASKTGGKAPMPPLTQAMEEAMAVTEAAGEPQEDRQADGRLLAEKQCESDVVEHGAGHPAAHLKRRRNTSKTGGKAPMPPLTPPMEEAMAVTEAAGEPQEDRQAHGWLLAQKQCKSHVVEHGAGHPAAHRKRRRNTSEIGGEASMPPLTQAMEEAMSATQAAGEPQEERQVDGWQLAEKQCELHVAEHPAKLLAAQRQRSRNASKIGRKASMPSLTQAMEEVLAAAPVAPKPQAERQAYGRQLLEQECESQVVEHPANVPGAQLTEPVENVLPFSSQPHAQAELLQHRHAEDVCGSDAVDNRCTNYDAEEACLARKKDKMYMESKVVTLSGEQDISEPARDSSTRGSSRGAISCCRVRQNQAALPFSSARGGLLHVLHGALVLTYESDQPSGSGERHKRTLKQGDTAVLPRYDQHQRVHVTPVPGVGGQCAARYLFLSMRDGGADARDIAGPKP